jgi:hypothetical protein
MAGYWLMNCEQNKDEWFQFLRYLQMTKENRVKDETLWEKMYVTLSTFRNLEHRALRWCGHTKQIKEKTFWKNWSLPEE